ncbi:MAG: DNA replication and repair protein RecF [Candidatus Peribacteraceae bacterium]|nr:DNA replication and repair protein RecF [Candidatus Peribacteraceae bacterium]
MRLLSLSLEQYRNYHALSVEFPPDDLHLFVGPNGSGKTNLLEAVALLSLTKSFLGLEEEDLMQWGTEFYRVKATMRTDGGETEELEVVSQVLPRKQKACFHNGVKLPLSTLVGRLPIVTFLPQELSLFSGPPADRRRFLDQILCQVSPAYFVALMSYQKALKQRNALLKSIAERSADVSFLPPWDQELALYGAELTLMRLELVETFNLALREEVQALGETWETVCVRYQRSGTAREQSALQAEILGALLACRERDVILRSTTVGPHRDDWSVDVDGRALPTFASRGQQRVAVLALLLLQASYLEVRRGEKPVILLDDIFSELDEAHCKHLLDAFADHQILMTAAELPVETNAFKGSIRAVKDGQVRDVSLTR